MAPSGLAALAQAAGAANGERSPNWKDCHEIYPPLDDIAKALQDTGKLVNCRTKAGRERGLKRTQCDLIQKLAGNICKKTKELYKATGLTENASRGRLPLVLEIVNNRKAFDTADVMIDFHPYNKDGKVFLVNNEVPYAGIDSCVQRFQEHIEDSVRAKAAQRTPDDGVRCAAIMLDPKHRGSVAGVMSNKKDRNKSDVSGDPVENFFSQAVIDFLNPSYQVQQPKEENVREFPEEDRACWEPDNPTIMEHDRDGKWLMDTWFQHIKPKYRHSLNKWNKDTGGGSGEVHEFINYCSHDRWLGWVFALDYEASFLLAANTCGQMPARLQLESGWDDVVSELGEDDTRASSSGRSSAEKKIKKTTDDISDLNKLIGELVKSKSNTVPDAPDKPNFHFCMERAACYREEIKNVEGDSALSPDTKELTVRMLKRKKKRLHQLAEEADAKRYKTGDDDE